MLCILYTPSPVALIFCTCVLIPLVEFKNALFNMFESLILFFRGKRWPQAKRYGLPVDRFGDLGGGGGGGGEACSVCLVEFAGEDLATKLSRCGHVFHTDCITSWLDRDNFTCPLCRSFVLEYCIGS